MKLLDLAGIARAYVDVFGHPPKYIYIGQSDFENIADWKEGVRKVEVITELI